METCNNTKCPSLDIRDNNNHLRRWQHTYIRNCIFLRKKRNILKLCSEIPKDLGRSQMQDELVWFHVPVKKRKR